jgi:hypothetical protein
MCQDTNYEAGTTKGQCKAQTPRKVAVILVLEGIGLEFRSHMDVAQKPLRDSC